MNDIPLRISENTTIKGSHPVILLGPNGAGKTRLAVSLGMEHDADNILALRNIALPPDIAMQSLQRANAQLSQELQRRRGEPWHMANEINHLFSKLVAENAASAIRFRDQHTRDPSAKPEITKLMRLSESWARLFPGRTIDFTDHQPRVRSAYSSSGAEYAAFQMSDGERVALYLAGRVLDSKQGIIIIDEPEVHFHSRLAARFWNELERLRADCRFVYVTHDLHFALSRTNATFVLVRPNVSPEVISVKDGAPRELTQSLLAAASFSVFAARVVFCEGEEGGRDQTFYSAWFRGNDTTIMPVGSCRDVARCATAFSEDRLVTGLTALGIIDRDYWPEAYLQALPACIFKLSVHEVESLFCLRAVFSAIAKHLGHSEDEINSRYDSFLQRGRAAFTGGLLAKQVSERFRRRCEHEFTGTLNSLSLSSDLDALQAHHERSVHPDAWVTSPATVFAEERKSVQDAVFAQEATFLRILPGKTVLPYAAEALRMQYPAYVELICAALQADSTSSLAPLGVALEGALQAYLPPRRPSNGTSTSSVGEQVVPA